MTEFASWEDRRAVTRLLRRHADDSGIVFDVRWPITCRYWPAPCEHVLCFERTWLGRIERFRRDRVQRRRPVFVALTPGRYRLLLMSGGLGDHPDQVDMDVRVRRRSPVLITAFPAKRRGVTPARNRTSWSVDYPDLGLADNAAGSRD